MRRERDAGYALSDMTKEQIDAYKLSPNYLKYEKKYKIMEIDIGVEYAQINQEEEKESGGEIVLETRLKQYEKLDANDPGLESQELQIRKQLSGLLLNALESKNDNDNDVVVEGIRGISKSYQKIYRTNSSDIHLKMVTDLIELTSYSS